MRRRFAIVTALLATMCFSLPGASASVPKQLILEDFVDYFG